MGVDKLVAVMSGRATYDVMGASDTSSTPAGEIPTEERITSGTQTLKNKVLDDATTKFADTADTTKDLFVSLGGATTAKTMTIVSSQTADRSLTLPDATDTLVGKATTDTLTNKTLDDATVKFADTADATKDLFVSLGGATTAKTMTIVSSQTDDRSLTLPDATDTLVGKATTDTLTNKTLDDATVKFADTADTTKDLFVSLGGATTAKTMTIVSSQTDDRSLTLPDTTDTLATLTDVAAQNIYLRGEVADISTGASAWVTSPVAGTITGITSVIDGAITVGDATLSFEIGGVAVTNGNITIAFSGSAAGTVDSSTPTAANTVTAGQAIEIITDGGSTDAAGAVVLIEITPSAAAPKKVYVTGEIADVSTGASTWVTTSIAGTVTKIWSVIDGAIAAVDAGLSFEIAGTPITGGGITIAFSGSAAGDVDSATPSAANTVTANQAIELITDGASTNAVKAVILLEITAA